MHYTILIVRAASARVGGKPQKGKMDDPASGAAVGVTLFPADYETVEMITDQGQEILQR